MKKSIHTPEYKTLLKLLIQVRTESQMGQVELAQKLGKPQSFVSKYESGERRLDLVELRTICQALDVSLADVVDQFESELDKP